MKLQRFSKQELRAASGNDGLRILARASVSAGMKSFFCLFHVLGTLNGLG